MSLHFKIWSNDRFKNVTYITQVRQKSKLIWMDFQRKPRAKKKLKRSILYWMDREKYKIQCSHIYWVIETYRGFEPQTLFNHIEWNLNQLEQSWIVLDVSAGTKAQGSSMWRSCSWGSSHTNEQLLMLCSPFYTVAEAHWLPATCQLVGGWMEPFKVNTSLSKSSPQNPVGKG